jgi:hypothetical protein
VKAGRSSLAIFPQRHNIALSFCRQISIRKMWTDSFLEEEFERYQWTKRDTSYTEESSGSHCMQTK